MPRPLPEFERRTPARALALALTAALLSSSASAVSALTASAAAPSVAALPQAKTEEVNARVTSFVPGTGIVIDRGIRDGLEIGDRVIFTDRGGRQHFGLITELEGRVATVRSEDTSFTAEPGTRATVLVPASRFEDPAPKTPSKVPVPKPSTPESDGSSEESAKTAPLTDDRWSRPDDGFTMDMPLLAEVNAVPPDRRASKITGRQYLSFDRIVDTEDERGDSFLRFGGAAYGENLFGLGGILHLDAEQNYRKTQLPDANDESESTFRLDRLSYTLGGNRHDWRRLRFGRFLQDSMPEFGVLDGASFSQRLDSGDSYGGSVGFLPEPDQDQQSFEDFQLAAWYRWVADEREILSLTGGYQKTWHNGTRDRDLVVLKSQYVPAEGWNVFGSAWVDIYGVNDLVKDSGPTLTYALIDARRRFDNDLVLNLDYRHQEYPELRRNEFPPVGLPQIQDAHVDRLGGTISRWTKGGATEELAKRVYLRAGAWADEEDSGGDGEVGVDLYDLFADDARLDLAFFASESKFSSLYGARVRFGRYGPRRSWSLQYEIRQNDVTGFDNNVDGLYQHRARGSYELFRASGVSASFSGEVQFQDREDQLFLGLFLQRSF
ncbi:MAG: hypothetical protein AAGG01_04565 [Planctomycetota bacterium]